MSTHSVMRPASDKRSADLGNDHLAVDAVDTFEITARLETSGISDRTVRRHYGASDVFDYAQSLVQVRESTGAPQGPEAWVSRSALLEAVRRALVLILGAVMGGLTATVLAVGTTDVLVAGVCAWVLGQAVSGIVWVHAGTGHLERGIARGSGIAVLIGMVLTGYILVLLWLPGHDATMAALTMAWSWYSCVVSMLVILGRSWYLLTILASAVTAMTLALVLGHEAATGIVVTIAMLVIVAVTSALVMAVHTIKERRVPTRGDWNAALAPAAQAAFLAAALSVALIRLPEWEGTALIVATVVAAAATDPALVLMRQRLVWSSNRTPLLRHAARHAWILTLMMSTAIVIVSAAVSTLVVVFLVEDTGAVTVIVAAAFSSLATTSTTLNAFGLPRGGVISAGAACLSAVAWITLGNGPGILLAIVFLAVGIVMLLARVSDPRAYA